MLHRIIPFLATVALCLHASCWTGNPGPTPLRVPPLELRVSHVAGPLLTGRQAQPGLATNLDTGSALAIDCEVSYLRTLRTGDLPRVATRTRLVVAGRSGSPLRPVSEASTGAVVGTGTEANQLLDVIAEARDDRLPLATLRGILFPGITTSFHAHGDGTNRRDAVILVSLEEAATQKIAVALQIDDLRGTEGRVQNRQIVLLEDVPTVDGDSLVLVFPSPYVGDEGRAFLARLTARSLGAEDPERAELTRRCREDLRREADTAQADGAPVREQEALSMALSTSLRALDMAQNHRPSLVFLANTTGAKLALDLALAADAKTLGAWVQAVNGGEPWPEQDAAGELGWTLERSAFELLAKRLDENQLATNLKGLLAEHAGELGRFPGALPPVLARCKNRADLSRELRDGNREFLESADPKERLRAFDWLVRRGSTPDGYDPLGPRRERREALAKDTAAREAAARQAAAREAEAKKAAAKNASAEDASKRQEAGR